jgi:hypothetical protein
MKKPIFLMLLFAFLVACVGTGNSSVTPINSPTLQRVGGFELSFSALSNPSQFSASLKSTKLTSNNFFSSDNLTYNLVSQSTFVLNATRYLSATFRFANAGSATVNTFLAQVKAGRTIDDTAISRLNKFDGTPADTAIAKNIKPTHGMVLSGVAQNTVVTNPTASDFQAFAEEDIAGYTPADGGYLLPWGFVAKSQTGNYLSSNDHYVTFAFKMPSNNNPNTDPYSFSVFLEAVFDTANPYRLTESLEEQSNPTTVATRATKVNADQYTNNNTVQANVFPGSVYNGASRILCSVRTAGTASNPTAFLFPPAFDLVQNGFTPRLENLTSVPRDSAFFVGLNGDVNAATYGNMTAHSAYRKFSNAVGNAFKPNVMNIPATSLSAGENIQISINPLLENTTGNKLCRPYVYEATAASDPANGLQTVVHETVAGDHVTLVVADFNGDGLTDVASVERGNSGFSVMLSQVGGGSSTTEYTVANLDDIATADFNGDGKSDIVTVGQSTGVYVSINNGNGVFSSRILQGGSGNQVRTGDFNGDGWQDFVVTLKSIKAFYVYFNQGNGNFPNVPSIFALDNAAGINSLEVSDMDSNGTLDFVMTRKVITGIGLNDVISYATDIFSNNGKGYFSQNHRVFGGEENQSLLSTDFNKDNKKDLIQAANNRLSIFLQTSIDSRFQFLSTSYFLDTNIKKVTLGDFNGDGFQDVAVIKENNTLQIYFNDTTGQLTPSVNYGFGTEIPTSLASGDFNNDGTLDIITGNTTGTLSKYYSSQTTRIDPSAVVLSPTDSRTLSIQSSSNKTVIPFNGTNWNSSMSAMVDVSSTGTVSKGILASGMSIVSPFTNTNPKGSDPLLPPTPGPSAKVGYTQNALLGALDLNGSTDRVNAENNLATGLNGNFTIEAWVKFPANYALTDDVVILEKRAFNGSIFPYSLRLTNNQKLRFDRKNQSGGAESIESSSSTLFTDGAWHHIAVTRELRTTLGLPISYNANHVLYVDGVQVATDSDPISNTDVANNTSKLFIGAASDNSQNANMQIDEVRMWLETKPASYFTASNRDNPLSSSTNIAVYYNMNEISKMGIKDSFIPANTGNLENMTGLELVNR